MLDGEVNIKYGGDDILAKKGDSILIPAELCVNLVGKAEMLLTAY